MNCKMWLLVTVVILVAYGLYEYIRVAPLVSTSRDLATNAVTFERGAGNHAVRILVAGDSTAVGVGSDPEYSVAGRLAEDLNAFIENVSKSGAKMEDVVDQLARARRTSYDLLVIHAGANDVMYFSNFDEVATHTNFALEKAHTLSDKVVLLTSGDIGKAPLWPRPVGWLMTSRTKKVRGIIKPKVEGSGAEYVDLYMLPDPFADDPKRYYAPDLLHLSGDGYGVWFEHITDVVKNRWPELYEQN